ncbi:HpcH/HpaI aldolase/citrate lyase family protein [Nonomuraea spiralis]|uniref:HpcH/HpaI aldolase/citrate lyase family protein n=1 Tax=Nonomuraea spiralis TaxID=46182 RepID=A0ABV5IT15_9ACTN|nr:aldolase/citrate lyase family protein [Nonomuraea spiralis]GGT16932.1 CoA ester lyase [Nonomuraea spiralis]
MTARSYLYVPGDAAGKLAKAAGRGADALIVDLEDAVRHTGKAAARTAVADWLAQGPRGPEIWVRVNPGSAGHVDAKAVVRSALTGLCMAKAENAAEVEALAAVLDQAEEAAGLAPGTISLMPLLESANAVFEARAIALAPRVTRLQLGEADLAADLGITPGPDGRELLWARSQVVAASAAAGIAPPVAPVSVEVRDLAAFRLSTEALARLGFVGRACVHPAQLPVAHEVFTPSAEVLAAAGALLDRYDQALAAGTAVCLDEAGRLVDEAVVRSARRVMGMAR